MIPAQWCLEDCGNDSHQHVAQCRHSLVRGRGDGYRGDQAEFDQAQNHRRTRMLQEYLGALDATTRDQAVVEVSQELRDLGLDPRQFLSESSDPRMNIRRGEAPQATAVRGR